MPGQLIGRPAHVLTYVDAMAQTSLCLPHIHKHKCISMYMYACFKSKPHSPNGHFYIRHNVMFKMSKPFCAIIIRNELHSKIWMKM